VLEDVQLSAMTFNALRLSLEFHDLIREGYSQDSFYGDEGEWTKNIRMEARSGYFCCLGRLCISSNSELRVRVITEMHDNSAACHIGVANTLAKALGRIWWKRIRQDVKDFCERYAVCRRAKIQPHMAATLNPLHVPPRPWDTIGLDYLTHLPVSNDFDSVLIVVDHLTRMAHFLPCTESVTAKETATLFYIESTDYTDCLECWSMTGTRNSSVAFGMRFGDALERDSTCLRIDTQKRMD
jgi:hypothetical protein